LQALECIIHVCLPLGPAGSPSQAFLLAVLCTACIAGLPSSQAGRVSARSPDGPALPLRWHTCRSWKLWVNTIESQEIPDGAQFSDIIIPTKDSARWVGAAAWNTALQRPVASLLTREPNGPRCSMHHRQPRATSHRGTVVLHSHRPQTATCRLLAQSEYACCSILFSSPQVQSATFFI
jgi:hypothetical protein